MSRRTSRTLFLEPLEDRLVPCCGCTTNPGIAAIAQQVVAPGSSSNPIPINVCNPDGDPIEVTATVSGAIPANALNSGDVQVQCCEYPWSVQIYDPENVVGSATVTLTATDECTGQTGQTSFPVVIDVPPGLILPQGTSFSQPAGQFPLTFPAVAGSSLNRPVTVTGQVSASDLFNTQQRYEFSGVGYTSAGAPAYVLESSQPGPGVDGYYLLRPSDGALFPYDGSGSFDNTLSGTPLAVLGANVYSDPNLLINAQPSEDYASLYALQQQYQFNGVGYNTAGVSAYVLQATTGNNAFGNPYYLLSTTGSVYAYDGSGSYSSSIDNGTPLATFDSSLYAFPQELTNASASPAIYNTLYPLQQQYDLHEYQGSFYTNTYGHEAQWLYSPILNQFGQHWYTLTLQTVNNTQQAVLTAWEGYQDSEVGAVIATLDPSVYANPQWLTNATALPYAAVTDTADSSGNLTIGLPGANFVGTFQVTVNASDGLLTTSQAVQITVSAAAPTITASQNGTTIPQGGSQSFTAGSFPQTDTVVVSDADGSTPSVTASVSSYDLPFSLEQKYQFQGGGYSVLGAPAYLLTADANNVYGNPTYLLNVNGALYPYDGSGNYAETFANVAPVATLGANFYADPTLLLNARPPVNYAQLYGLRQQYGFQGLGYLTADTTAYVLQAKTANAAGNPYYLLSPAGGLYAYDGSGSYAHTFANSANLVATLDPSVYASPSLLTGALATPDLYQQLQAVEQQYDLKGLGNYVFGAPAYVLTGVTNHADNNPYYLLNSSGDLYAYDGSGSYAHTFANSANLVATLDPSVYANPTLLTSATAPLAATGVTASLANGTLTLDAPAAFVGTFQVTVSATDGLLTSTQTFLVNATDPPPVPAAVLSQTSPASGAGEVLALQSASGGSTAATYNQGQDDEFTGVGYVTVNGATVYVLPRPVTATA